MQPARLRLGQLLIDAHILAPQQLEEVLARQKSDGRRLGALLVESGLVTETLLAQILSQQLSVPWVSLYHIDFSRDLLSRVPGDIAQKYCLMPIYVRPVRGQGDTLYVAMEDPMNDEALRDCAASSGLPTRAMIAAPTDIVRAIRLCYGLPEGVAPSAPPSPPAAEPTSPGAPGGDATAPPMTTKRRRSSRAPAPRVAEHNGGLVVAAVQDDDAPEVEAHEVDLSKRFRKQGRQLTLLDGTTINLPTAKKGAAEAERRSEPPPMHALTAADLLAALRAAAHGVDAREILGENLRWEKAMAAVLSLLLRKHLILEEELLDELNKI